MYTRAIVDVARASCAIGVATEKSGRLEVGLVWMTLQKSWWRADQQSHQVSSTPPQARAGVVVGCPKRQQLIKTEPRLVLELRELHFQLVSPALAKRDRKKWKQTDLVKVIQDVAGLITWNEVVVRCPALDFTWILTLSWAVFIGSRLMSSSSTLLGLRDLFVSLILVSMMLMPDPRGSGAGRSPGLVEARPPNLPHPPPLLQLPPKLASLTSNVQPDL